VPPPIAAAPAPPPVDVGPRVVRTESIITFDGRWAAPPPPAIEREEVHPVREDVVSEVTGAAVVSPPALRPSRHPRLRSRPARLDVCQRHNMRKVMVGKYRWRCRR
jgi:hypothetical protein